MKNGWIVNQHGVRYHYVNDEIHCDDGPAIETSSGAKLWYNNNKLHNDNGPAIVNSSGSKEWWFNDKLHNDNGPAIEYSSGTKEWWINGLRHREDGPAIESYHGSKEWWINDKYATQDIGNAKFLVSDGSYSLMYYNGEYYAGCHHFTRQKALDHWANRNDDRAKLFTQAIMEHVE